MATRSHPLPRANRRRLSWPLAARLVLPGAILVSLLVELALAERKFAIFGGGFGQSRTLDAPLEIAAFAAPLIACHGLLFYLAYRALHRLHRRRADTPLFHLNFLFVALGGWIGALFAKYQALAYFSDAMSFQIVRNLGGGSLYEALLYSLSEAGLIAIAALGAAAAYAAAWLFLRRWRKKPPLPDRARLPRRWVIAALLLLPALLFAANRIDDSRAALARFNAVVLVSALLHQASDLDRDGWSWFSHPIDLHPLDGSRHPYALDTPGNGIDEDGFGGDLAFTASAPPTAPVIPLPRPHVVLIVLESTRADVIGKRIDGRPVAPNLERLARRGSAARAAYSHVGFTAASLKSLFTGSLEPAPGGPSLVRDFAANDYGTAVFSGQAEGFGDIATATGTRDAAIFVDAETLREERAFGFGARGSLYIDGRLLLREFDRRLGDPAQWETPRFVYFNFQSAHFPYHAPGMDRILPGEPLPRSEISAANRERLEATYWNAVAYNDRLIGELLARLRRLGALDETLIVVTADHGESLFDDGFLGHGHMLNAQQTAIPFVLSRPGVAIPAPLGLADMRAVILAAAGADVADPRPGNPVFQYLGGLDRPGAIGAVDARGRWTVFDLGEETLRIGEAAPVRYSELPPRAKAAADALIDRWARERWRRHLASRD